MRAPERLISSLGALGRWARRRRRVLCVFACVCAFVCVFVRRVGRRRAGRDPSTKETLRFCLLGWVAASPRNDPPLQNCKSEITFWRKKRLKMKVWRCFALKTSYFVMPFSNTTHFYTVFHIFENRSNIHLKIFLKVLSKVM